MTSGTYFSIEERELAVKGFRTWMGFDHNTRGRTLRDCGKRLGPPGTLVKGIIEDNILFC